MIPTAHPTPQPKRHRDRFIRFRTGDRRVSYTLQRDAPFPLQNYPFLWEDLQPPSNMWFLGSTRVLNPNGISIGAAVFCRCHYVTVLRCGLIIYTVTSGQTVKVI